MNFLFFLILPMLVGFWAQMRVSSAFSKYSQIRASSNRTGAEAANEILRASGIDDVQVVETAGWMGDHYDPMSKKVCLTPETYRTPSLAAVGIAAHEVGHAIQHAKAYGPLHLRMALVPVTQVASNLLPYIMIGGIWFHFFALVKLGVVVYVILTLFQLITLPVEFDASRRAKIVLRDMNLIQPGPEAEGVSRMLNAAAWTYVAAFLAALGNLLWLLSITQRRND